MKILFCYIRERFLDNWSVEFYNARVSLEAIYQDTETRMPNKNNEKERKKSYNKIIMKIEEANFTPLVTTKLRENFAA